MTRKISRSVAKIHLGQLESFSLGNLDSKRDWGHANDYVEVKHTQAERNTHKLCVQCFRVERGSDVHIALTGHVFPDHLRPQYVICMKPRMILCQKRNRDRERKGERERAACCEATDCTLVSHNSPMS